MLDTASKGQDGKSELSIAHSFFVGGRVHGNRIRWHSSGKASFEVHGVGVSGMPLLLHTLSLLRNLSPDYLRGSLAQAETLLWLDQAHALPRQAAAAKTGGAKTGGVKAGQKKR